MDAFSKILTGAAGVVLAALILAGPLGLGRKCPINVAGAEPGTALVSPKGATPLAKGS
jgi:hypothetical protein